MSQTNPKWDCPNCYAVAQQLLGSKQDSIARKGPKFLARAVEDMRADLAVAAVSPPVSGWRDISSAPKDGTQVLLRTPIDNGSDPKYQAVVGFYAPAGTLEMDGDTDESLVDESGMNTEDAWIEVSASREPWAWCMNYRPTHWLPLPQPIPDPPVDEESEGA